MGWIIIHDKQNVLEGEVRKDRSYNKTGKSKLITYFLRSIVFESRSLEVPRIST